MRWRIGIASSVGTRRSKASARAGAPTIILGLRTTRRRFTARDAGKCCAAVTRNSMPERRRPPTNRPKKSSRKRSAPSRPAKAARGDQSRLLLGAHVSIGGGTNEAPARAKAIGATALQMFTKMAQRWAERACADDECRAFRSALAATDVRVTVAHDSYLINLASPDPALRRRSIESFVAELARCEALGLNFLVSHPGNYIDDRMAGIARNADAISEALERVPGGTGLCMELTSGSGTAIGSSF